MDSSKDHVEKDSETPQLQMLSSLSDGTCKSEGESLVQKGIFYNKGYESICKPLSQMYNVQLENYTPFISLMNRFELTKSN